MLVRLLLLTKLADDLQDFVEEFDDGKVQFGFARVSDPNSNLPKFVLIGWAGEGVPERVKGYFNGNFSTIAKYFHGYHVQITARSQDDLSVPAILSKVESASGAKYSSGIHATTVRTRPTYSVSNTGANEDDWGDDAPPVVESEVTKVQSSYRPTKVDISAIKSSAPSSSAHALTPAEPVRGSYQPVGKVDIAALRAQAKDDKFNPKPSPLQSSYKPVGKVDIAAIRAQAGKKPSSFASEPKVTPAPTPASPSKEDEDEYKPTSVHDRLKNFGGNSASSPAGGDDEDEAPKSLKDRLKSYQNNAEPLKSLPKPKTKNSVASRFGAGAASSGTVPPLPGNSFGGPSKVVGGASRDFGSSGGKTPAQIWAEKHAKNAGASAPVSAPVSTSEDNDEAPVETPSIADIRSKFASTTVSETHDTNGEIEEEGDEHAPDVSDLKSKFAQKFAAQSPSPVPQSKEVTPEPAPPSLPTRSLPPPPAEQTLSPPPAPASPSPEPEVAAPPPLPTAERSLPPPLPTAGRALPPPFIPPTAAEPESTTEPEEEPVAAPPPSLPQRAPEPEPVAQEAAPSADGLPIDAVVLYDYAKDDENELALHDGETITVLEFTDVEWWLGSNASGEKGLFPAEYVQLLKPPYAIATFSYTATESNELTFPEKAIITEIEFDDEDWWSGVYMNQRNLFPSNYVELQQK